MSRNDRNNRIKQSFEEGKAVKVRVRIGHAPVVCVFEPKGFTSFTSTWKGNITIKGITVTGWVNRDGYAYVSDNDMLKLPEELRLKAKYQHYKRAIRTKVHFFKGGGGLGLQGAYYDSSEREWKYLDDPPSTHWEDWDGTTLPALICRRCGDVIALPREESTWRNLYELFEEHYRVFHDYDDKDDQDDDDEDDLDY